MKIDSQGYATVIPTGEVLDDDEIDCLKFSDSEQCPVDPSQLVCRNDDGEFSWREQRKNGYAPLTPQRRRESTRQPSSMQNEEVDVEESGDESPLPSPPLSTTPQDYEVPMNILQQSPCRSSTVGSPRLTRQRAVSSTSEAETRDPSHAAGSVSGVEQEEETRGPSHAAGSVSGVEQEEETRDSSHAAGSVSGVEQEEETRDSSHAAGSVSGVEQEEETIKTEEDKEETKPQDEVFVDSGVETSADSQQGSVDVANSKNGSALDEPKKQDGHNETPPTSEQRHCEPTSCDIRANGSTRSRSMTVHSLLSVAGNHSGGEVCVRYDGTRLQRDRRSLHRRQTSMPSLEQPNALHISLDRNRHAIV